jgi:hypothetical protein
MVSGEVVSFGFHLWAARAYVLNHCSPQIDAGDNCEGGRFSGVKAAAVSSSIVEIGTLRGVVPNSSLTPRQEQPFT